MASKRVDIDGLGTVTITRGARPGAFLADGEVVLDWATPWGVEFVVQRGRVILTAWSMNLESARRYERAVRDGLQAALKVRPG